MKGFAEIYYCEVDSCLIVQCVYNQHRWIGGTIGTKADPSW